MHPMTWTSTIAIPLSTKSSSLVESVYASLTFIVNGNLTFSYDVCSGLMSALGSAARSSYLSDSSTQLQTYRGKELLTASSTEGATSSQHTTNDQRSFAWSRGLGVELSPLQTRSSRKKKEVKVSLQSASTDTTKSEKAPLRALKAIARSK
jgi:hypothetical protein